MMGAGRHGDGRGGPARWNLHLSALAYLGTLPKKNIDFLLCEIHFYKLWMLV